MPFKQFFLKFTVDIWTRKYIFIFYIKVVCKSYDLITSL